MTRMDVDSTLVTGEVIEMLAAHAGSLDACGPLRTMGHNSPMVPASRRFFEVEIPVRWTERARGN